MRALVAALSLILGIHANVNFWNLSNYLNCYQFPVRSFDEEIFVRHESTDESDFNFHNQPLVAFGNASSIISSDFNQVFGDRNKSSIIYFELKKIETFYLLLKKFVNLSFLGRTHVQISLNLTGQNDNSSIHEKTKAFIRRSNFYQESPLFLQVINSSGSRPRCLIGYRIDTINPNSILKDVSLTLCQEQKNSRPNSLKLYHASLSATTTNDFDGSDVIVAGVYLGPTDSDYNYDTEMAVERFENGTERFSFKGGYSISILRGMETILNFRSIPYASYAWGEYNNQSGWRGAVGDVAERRADICISSTTYAPSRSGVAFNFGTVVISIGVYFKRHLTYATHYEYTLLAPFHFTLWRSILLWVVANFFIYWQFIKYEKNKYSDNEIDGQAKMCPGSILSMSLNPLCQRGCSRIPSNFGIRILYFCQLVTGLILFSSYNGILVAFLSTEKPAIQSLTDLLSDKYSFKFGVIDYPVTRKYLSTCFCSEPILKDIFRRAMVPGTNGEFIMYDWPYEEVRIGKLAFVADDKSSFLQFQKWENASDACEIQEIAIRGSKQQQGTFVRKFSKIKKAIDYSVIKLMETGNVQLLKSRFLPRKIVCKKERTFSGANLSDMKLAYVILTSFLGISAFILVGELLYSYLSFKYRMAKILNGGLLLN